MKSLKQENNNQIGVSESEMDRKRVRRELEGQ